MRAYIFITMLLASSLSIASGSDQALRDAFVQSIPFEKLGVDSIDQSLYIELGMGPKIAENDAASSKRARKYIKLYDTKDDIFYETALFLADCETYKIGFRNYKQAYIKNGVSIIEKPIQAPENIQLNPKYPKDASYFYRLFYNACNNYFALKDHYGKQ